MAWFKRSLPHAKPGPPRFARLKGMSLVERAAALAGPEGARWIWSAAEYGFVEAQLLLGQRLLGAGDAERALRWFRVAAAAGHLPAINMVGRCLEKGWGTRSDLAGSADWYRQAAERGLDWAQFNLANLLLYGLGVALDRSQALHWYGRAAGQGHAKSMNMLGRFEDEGWTGPRNPAAAAIWYRRAAESGDYRGQFNYGTVLAIQGRLEHARPLFKAALASGDGEFVSEACAKLLASRDPFLCALARLAMQNGGSVKSAECCALPALAQEHC